MYNMHLWTKHKIKPNLKVKLPLICIKQHHLMALCLGQPGWASTRKEKPIWSYWSGSGISRAICKSAPSPRQITMPALHHSVFYRLDALPAAKPTASKHWRQLHTYNIYPHFHSTSNCQILYITQYEQMRSNARWCFSGQAFSSSSATMLNMPANH